jgi:toxin ParE1/3/4
MTEPQVAYSLAAERDLTQLFAWIAADSGPQRANAILTRIEGAISTVAAFPRLGRLRHELESGIRSFAVYPWVILYKPLSQGEGIFVVRVVDGRRDVPRLFGQ